MIARINRALKQPYRTFNIIKGRATASFRSKTYSSIVEGRSESDDGAYVDAIKRALNSQRAFNNFKQDPDYQVILEHVSPEQGQAYIDILRARNDGLLDRSLNTLLTWDKAGNPQKYAFAGFSIPLSTTTIRYIKVASDLHKLFGSKLGRVAEIGCGYGGQFLTNDTLLDVEKGYLFDIPVVNQLISRYIEQFVLKSSFETATINTKLADYYDLVISNYAFSELPKSLQIKYIDKVLGSAKRGYLTMNSGRGGDFDASFPKLSLAELETLLPKFTIFEEQPLTSPHNYIIAWGHDDGATLAA